MKTWSSLCTRLNFEMSFLSTARYYFRYTVRDSYTAAENVKASEVKFYQTTKKWCLPCCTSSNDRDARERDAIKSLEIVLS